MPRGTIIAGNGNMKRRVRRKKASGYSKYMTEAMRTRSGKKALARYRRFWGIKHPPTVKRYGSGGKTTVLVGLGRSPAVSIADGPKGRAKKIRRIRHSGTLATDAGGRRLYILKSRGREPGKKNLKFLGWSPTVEYIPTRAIEKSGSFKRNRHWIHKFGEEGGSWPKIFKDKNGNYVYSKSSFKVGKWIIN